MWGKAKSSVGLFAPNLSCPGHLPLGAVPLRGLLDRRGQQFGGRRGRGDLGAGQLDRATFSDDHKRRPVGRMGLMWLAALEQSDHRPTQRLGATDGFVGRHGADGGLD